MDYPLEYDAGIGDARGQSRRVLIWFALFVAFTGWAVFGAAATVVFPPAAIVFIAPLFIAIVACAPSARAAPKKVALVLLTVGIGLLPLWPVYLHIKLGPLPIITPPRLLLYAATALWLYDMVFSKLRRAQLLVGLRRGGWTSRLVLAMFALSFMSVPFASGRTLAGPEFFRQTIIWFIPFLMAVTYVRRQADLLLVVKAVAAGAVVAGFIAIAEAASGRLLASTLAPLIPNDQEWLRVAQQLKIRDGIFRAQASHTHPLSLGEYLAVAAPFAFALAAKARQRRASFLWGIAGLMIVVGALLTNSRGALLALLVAAGACGLIVTLRALRHESANRFRPVAGLAMAALLCVSPLLAAAAYKTVTGAGTVSASNSSQGRIDQIDQAVPKIMKRPIGGYGAGRATRVLGYWGRTLTIDNYYLSLALDFGIPGPIVFLSIFLCMGHAALRRSRSAPNELAAIYVAFFALCAVFAISRGINSLTANLGLLYPLIGAFVGASASGWRERAR